MVEQENARLNPRGNTLTPAAWPPKSGSFSLHRSPYSWTPGPHSWGGRKEKWSGQTDGSSGDAAWVRWLSPVLGQNQHLVQSSRPAPGPAWCCVTQPFLKEQKPVSHEPPSVCILRTHFQPPDGLLRHPHHCPQTSSPEQLWKQRPWGRLAPLELSFFICKVWIVTVPTSHGYCEI